MTIEPGEQPYIDPGPENFGGSPHISEYLSVITRRLWLLLAIFTVTTASSIYGVSRERTSYSSTLAMQVNDPQEQSGGLVSFMSMGGMSLFVDPIVSEIQVLSSAAIREEVVDSLGLRLARVPEDEPRSLIMRNIWLSPDAPDFQLFRLVYNALGTHAQLNTADGSLLAEAPAGSLLDAGFVRFVVMGIGDELPRLFDLQTLPARAAAESIVFSAVQRPETNIVDVSLLHYDPVLAPEILNAAGLALRNKGAKRVRESANARVTFIEEQLATSEATLRASRDSLRNFKTTQQFTTLGSREQNLVNQMQRNSDVKEAQEREKLVLENLRDRIQDTTRIDDADLGAVLAQLLPNTNQQVRRLITSIEMEQAALRVLLNEQRLAEGNARVRAVKGEIVELRSQLVAAADASLSQVQGRLAQLQSREDTLQAQRAQFPELESKLLDLEATTRTNLEVHQFILTQLYQAQITGGATAPYVDILDPANGASAVGGGGAVTVLLGALLGLILGVGASFFLEYIDRTVRTSSDVESLLGIPVLGVIPRLRRLDDDPEGAAAVEGRGQPLVVALDPLDPAAEAYRNLRMNFMFMSSDDDPIRTVLFSSPGPAEGKSTTAINFAVMLAQQGQRVLMIDADLRRPSLHRALDLLREPGLTNLLIGDAKPRETIRPNVLPNLDFLPSGPFPPNPSELLSTNTMVRLIEEFEGRYDQVIIDSPPVLAVTDAAILAGHTDGVVIVLRSGETEQRAAERSVDQLRRLGVRVFGAVLNAVSTASSDESYYLQYYYSYTPAGMEAQSGWQKFRAGMSMVKFFQ